MFKTGALDSVANAYVDENTGTSTPGTRLEADDRNIIQDEIVNAIEGSSQTLDASGVFTNNDQLLKAILSTSSGISGFIISNNSGDSDHDIDISIGQGLDSTKTSVIKLQSAFTKQIDAAWVVGTGNGGLLTGSVAADTWYPVYAMLKDSDFSVDIGIGSIGSIPAGYTKYKRVGWVLTDGSANILNFTDSEVAGGSVEREWTARIVDKTGTGGGTVRQLLTVSCPANEIVRLILNVISTTTSRSWIASTNFTDIIPTDDISDCRNAVSATHQHAEKEISVDGSSQVAYRFDATPDTALYITTLGYTDRRVS